MENPFIRHIGSVLTGSLIAQLIPIAGTLLLARIFDPAAFGVFSAWLGVVLFLGVVVTCRFEAALAVEEDGQARSTAVVMIFMTIVLMSSLALFILAILSLVSASLSDKWPWELLLTLVPASALSAASQTLQNWAAADGRYRHLTVIRIAQASAIVILQILIGFFWPSGFGLGLGYFLGVCAGLGVAIAIMPLRKISLADSRNNLVSYWKRNRRFPIYSLPADAINTAAAQMPVLIVAARFGSETAGLLAMALRILGAPMSLLAVAVLDVFKRHAGQAYRERGECRDEYLHAFKMLLLVSVVAGIVIVVGAEPLFTLAFGELWVGAGTIALWLLPRFLLGFIASPLSYMVYIAGKQHLDLVWQLVLVAMTLVTLQLIDTVQWALIFYSLGYGMLYLVYIGMSYRFSVGVGR